MYVCGALCRLLLFVWSVGYNGSHVDVSCSTSQSSGTRRLTASELDTTASAATSLNIVFKQAVNWSIDKLTTDVESGEHVTDKRRRLAATLEINFRWGGEMAPLLVFISMTMQYQRQCIATILQWSVSNIMRVCPP